MPRSHSAAKLRDLSFEPDTPSRRTRRPNEPPLELLDEAERLYVGDFYPKVRPIAALKARVWVAQARWGDALGWAREQGLSAEDDLDYLREFEHITLARVLLAGSKRDRADHSLPEVMGFLERLRRAADEGDRMGSVRSWCCRRSQTRCMAMSLPLLRRSEAP